VEEENAKVFRPYSTRAHTEGGTFSHLSLSLSLSLFFAILSSKAIRKNFFSPRPLKGRGRVDLSRRWSEPWSYTLCLVLHTENCTLLCPRPQRSHFSRTLSRNSGGLQWFRESSTPLTFSCLALSLSLSLSLSLLLSLYGVESFQLILVEFAPFSKLFPVHFSEYQYCQVRPQVQRQRQQQQQQHRHSVMVVDGRTSLGRRPSDQVRKIEYFFLPIFNISKAGIKKRIFFLK